MKSTHSIFICEFRKAKCDALIESGVFDNISNLVDFSLRYFLFEMKAHGYRPGGIWRDAPFCKFSIKANDWVIDQILEMKVVAKSDMGDYALEHMFDALRKAGVMKDESSHPADGPGAGVRQVEEPSGDDVRDG